MTLGLEPEREAAGRPSTADDGSPRRLVEIAVDAAGAGGSRPYTYAVPADLADLQDGEAVLVEFGRRQALGIVLGPAEAAAGTGVKPIADRVRADGPLLPGLSLSLARWIAEHYLAPPALVIRSMLPPGLLERLELVAERTPMPLAGDHDRLDEVDADLLEQLSEGARPARVVALREDRVADVVAGAQRRSGALRMQRSASSSPRCRASQHRAFE